MSGMNINGRETSMIFYANKMDSDLWETLCSQAHKNPKECNWLRVNFDLSDVDDSDDDLTEGEML